MPHNWGRRKFLQAGAFLSAAAAGGRTWDSGPTSPTIPPNQAPRITQVILDLNGITKFDDSNGDAWDPFWADDGNLYAFNCDGRGFGSQGRNLAFNRLSGDSPSSLVGTQISSMDDYGTAGQVAADGATWKVGGQECIDGTFYAFVNRNIYGHQSRDPLMRQIAFDSSLIKSSDRGLTWSRSAAENYASPMWPGGGFGAPFFIHYGQNGGQVEADEARKYVYAVSTNGFWNDGDNLILARVKRDQLPHLQAGNWEYFAGQDKQQAQRWSAQIADARMVVNGPAKCGQSPVCYVPGLGLYLLICWYNVGVLTKWYEPDEMRYDFYQADHPWGPWSMIDSHSDRFLAKNSHMYGPSICAKFQEQRGSEIHLSLFTSGCPFEDEPSSLYKLWRIPLVLCTQQPPPYTAISSDDPAIQYAGTWAGHAAEKTSQPGSIQTSQVAGDSLSLAFEGTGIEYIAQKDKNLGDVNVYLDGVSQGRLSLKTQNLPRLSGVVVFGKYDLKPSSHVFKLENADGASINVEGFRICESRAQSGRPAASRRIGG